MKRRIVILGAAGRDFHNFNVAFREDPDVEVVGEPSLGSIVDRFIEQRPVPI